MNGSNLKSFTYKGPTKDLQRQVMKCAHDGCEMRVKPHNVAMRCSRCRGVFCDAHRTGVSHGCTFGAEPNECALVEKMRCKSSSLKDRV